MPNVSLIDEGYIALPTGLNSPIRQFRSPVLSGGANLPCPHQATQRNVVVPIPSKLKPGKVSRVPNFYQALRKGVQRRLVEACPEIRMSPTYEQPNLLASPNYSNRLQDTLMPPYSSFPILPHSLMPTLNYRACCKTIGKVDVEFL